MTHEPQQGILEAIVNERLRQDTLKKNGKFHHTMADHGMFAVLSEEVGEVARELNETSGAPNDDSALAAELVQVAAVCVAWLESIVNRNGGKLP